jgi:predicted phosphodiesterase
MDLIIESWIPSHRCICGSMGRMTLSHFKRDEFKILCEVCNHEIVLNYDLVTNYNSVSVDDDNDNVSTKYDCKIETQMIDSIDPFEIKDMDLYAETKRLSKSRQYQMDRNRIERKYWRNETRNNIWEEKLTENLINLLQKFDLSVNNNTIQTIKNKNQKCSAIIQVSDVHFNEIVDSVYGNSYNFEVASKRFKLFAEKSIKILNTYGVTDVVIAFCGDLMNNNKIEDKKLSQFYNRTTAMVVGCHLIESFIIDIATHFNVKVASVCGNESRIDDVGAIGFTNKIITDNFDYIIHNVLKILFRNVKNVKFVGGRFDEKILKILNRNILMTHGHTISAKDYSQNVQSLFAKHSAQELTLISFCLVISTIATSLTSCHEVALW